LEQTQRADDETAAPAHWQTLSTLHHASGDRLNRQILTDETAIDGSHRRGFDLSKTLRCSR